MSFVLLKNKKTDHFIVKSQRSDNNLSTTDYMTPGSYAV